MDGVTLSIISLLILMGLLSVGVPVAFCFSGSLLFMSIVGDISMKGMMMWGLQQILSPALLCIPLFIFAGALMSNSGIAKYLLDFVDIFVGRVKGGIGYVATVSSAIIGAISGSTFTGVAATGAILIPEMEKRGYPRPFATALVTVSSILGVLIPPSTPMIIFGWVTGTSVLACFLSTVIPGVLVVLIYCAINRFMVRKINLVIPPPISSKEKKREILTKSWGALPALMMPIIILGGIYGGMMTPNEAAAAAVIYSIPVGFWVYRGLSIKSFYNVSKSAAGSTGTIMVMIMCSMMLSQTYVLLQVPQHIVDVVFGLTDNKFVIPLIINLALLFVGMIVNDTTGIILVAPLLLPLTQAIGINPIQYAAMFVTNMAIGAVTPPYASLLYLGIRVGKVDFADILPPVGIFILGYIPVMLITTYWPPLSLWLPGLLGYV